MPPPCEAKDLLLVTNPNDGADLERLFRQCGMNVFAAADCQQARQRLSAGRDPQIVVTALSLRDGSWWSLRRTLIDQQSMAALIVCLPTADGGVTDVLEAGCAAVLVPPYTIDRVRTVIEASKARRIPPKPPLRAPHRAELSEATRRRRQHVA